MQNGSFEYLSPKGKIAGYIDKKGIYYIGEGHHRITAAMEIFTKTGNSSSLRQLLQNGKWTSVVNPPANARPLPSRAFWGNFRNWLGF